MKEKKDIKNKNIKNEADTEKANEILKENSEVEKLEEQLKEQKDKFLRIAAEYDNFRKRTEKEKLSIYSDALCVAVKEILPIGDNIERAIQALTGKEDDEYKKGLNMISEQFEGSLKKLKVESFGEVGEVFNPDIHSAVMHVDDENFGENEISSVFQKGYKCEDIVIRYAMVQVAN